MSDPISTAISPGQAAARRAGRFERRLRGVERIHSGVNFEDDAPTGSGNPPKPSGSPPDGTIATGYYPNKTAGFRTWLWTMADGEWYGLNAGA